MRKKMIVVLAAFVVAAMAIGGYIAFPWAQERFLLTRVQRGDVPAAIELASIYQGSVIGHCGDPARVRQGITRSRELLRAHAEEGDVDAMFALAVNYRDPMCRAIPGDRERSMFWAERAAQQGHMGAMSLLSGYYFSGNRAADPEDRARGVAWLMKQAHAGDASSQAAIGHRYLHGIDLPLDHDRARIWLERASLQGNEGAKQDLEVLDVNRL